MKLPEKVSYLQGLMDGMEIDITTKEGKLFKAIADILDDVALQLEDLEDQVDEIVEAVDELDEDLCDLEKEVYECDCCCDEDDDDFDVEDTDDALIPFYTGDGEAAFLDELEKEIDDDDDDIADFLDILDDDEDEEEEVAEAAEEAAEAIKAADDDLDDLPDDDDLDEADDEELYEVVCPTCNDSIYLTEKMLAEGSINCPGCGELLEFDMTDEEEE